MVTRATIGPVMFAAERGIVTSLVLPFGKVSAGPASVRVARVVVPLESVTATLPDDRAPGGLTGSKPRLLASRTTRLPLTRAADLTSAGRFKVVVMSAVNAGLGAMTVVLSGNAAHGAPQRSPSVRVDVAPASDRLKLLPEMVTEDGSSCATVNVVFSPSTMSRGSISGRSPILSTTSPPPTPNRTHPPRNHPPRVP